MAPERTIVDLLLPRLGETMDEGRITAWLKAPGDPFKRGETLLEVETDKTVVEVPALLDGVLIAQLAAPGAMVAVDAPIGQIEVDARAAPQSAPVRTAREPESAAELRPPQSAIPVGVPGPRPAASAAARRLARRRGVDLSALSGTGRRGRITGDDVRAAEDRDGDPGERRDRIIVDTAQGRIAFLDRQPDTSPTGTVVLIHGLFADADGFAALSRRLSRAGRRILALDLPAHGESPRGPTSPDGVARLIAAGLGDRLSGPVTLVGHSFGAVIATHLAADIDAARLVLLTPVGLGAEIDALFLTGLAEANGPDAIRREMRKLGGGLSAAMIADLAGHIASNRDALRAMVAGVAAGGVQQCFIADRLSALSCPVSAIFGLVDPIIPAHHAFALPPRVAGHFLQGIGHLPHAEAVDSVAELILSPAA